MFTRVLPLQKQLVFLCWSGRLQHSGLCLTLPSMPPVPLGWRPSLGCWVSHMTLVLQSHDRHMTVLAHYMYLPLYMLGSLVVTNNGSAGQVFDLSGVPREVQASDWNCYIFSSPSLLLFPSSTHSLPPTHTAHSRAWHYQHPGISTPSHWRAVSSLRQLSAPHPGQWSSPSSRSR